MKTLIWALVAIAALVLVILAVYAWLPARQSSADTVPKSAMAADVDAFLAPAQPALDASRRPVRRIALEPLPGDDLDVSKVGGRAWWPQDTPPPTGTQGEALVLLAQINFAEMPPMRGYPTEGLLQFFIAAKDDLLGATFDTPMTMASLATQRRFRIVYWSDPSLPAAALPQVADTHTPHTPDRPRRMRFTAGEERLSLGDYRFDRLFGGDAYGAAQTAAAARGVDTDSLYDGVWQRHSGTGHKIGGYPFFTQFDPRDGGDWELLLQLESDDEMMWGDLGIGNFFIAPSDLARGDFSRVAYNWDCH